MSTTTKCVFFLFLFVFLGIRKILTDIPSYLELQYDGCLMMYSFPYCRSQMWVMPFLLMNALLAMITLVVACMVSVGFAIFCDHYLEGLPSYLK